MRGPKLVGVEPDQPRVTQHQHRRGQAAQPAPFRQGHRVPADVPQFVRHAVVGTIRPGGLAARAAWVTI